MTIKGLAVISGSGENQGDIKHKMLSSGEAHLGSASKTSTLSGSVRIEGMDQDLVPTLHGLTGSLASRITTAIADQQAALGSLNVVSASIETDANYNLPTHNLNVVDATGTESTYAATSLVDADKKIDETLDDSRELHTTLTGDETVVGSLQHSIKTYLVGNTTTTMAQTLAALSASIDSDTVHSDLQTQIQQVKNDVSGETDTISRTLSAIKATLTGHVSAASQEDADIDALINTAKNNLGITRNGSVMTLTYDTSGIGGGLLTGTSLYGQDAVLDGKVQDETDRLKAMTGSADVVDRNGATIQKGTTSTMLSTTTTATFKGSVEFTSDAEFSVPVHDTVPSYLLDNGALKADMSAHEGEIIYLTAATAIAPFVVADKFYFCEGGQWFMSPFFSDADSDGVMDQNDAFPNDPAESADSDGDGVGDNADAFPNDASESADSDGDGVGDNADAYPNNAARSAADSAPTGLPAITSPSGNFQDNEVFSVDLSGISDADGAISAVSYSWLINGTASPIAVSGYYPLYSTEGEANAAHDGNGTSHSHLLDGVTYFMPSGLTMGVNQFHGDYAGDPTPGQNATFDVAALGAGEGINVSVEVVVSDGLETYTLTSAAVTITASAAAVQFTVYASTDPWAGPGGPGQESQLVIDGTPYIDGTTLDINDSQVAITFDYDPNNVGYSELAVSDSYGDGGIMVEFFEQNDTNNPLVHILGGATNPLRFPVDDSWTGNVTVRLVIPDTNSPENYDIYSADGSTIIASSYQDVVDTDGDGTLDSVDTDDDNDLEPDATDYAPLNNQIRYDNTRQMRFTVYRSTGDGINPNAIVEASSEAAGGFFQYSTYSMLTDPTYPDNNLVMKPSWGTNGSQAGQAFPTGHEWALARDNGYSYLFFNLPTDGTIHTFALKQAEAIDNVGLHFGVGPDNQYEGSTESVFLNDGIHGAHAGFGRAIQIRQTGNVVETRVADLDASQATPTTGWSAWTVADSDGDGTADDSDALPLEPPTTWTQLNMNHNPYLGGTAGALAPIQYVMPGSLAHGGDEFQNVPGGTTYTIDSQVDAGGSPVSLFAESGGTLYSTAQPNTNDGVYTVNITATAPHEAGGAPYVYSLALQVTVATVFVDQNFNTVLDADDIPLMQAEPGNTPVTLTVQDYASADPAVTPSYNLVTVRTTGELESINGVVFDLTDRYQSYGDGGPLWTDDADHPTTLGGMALSHATSGGNSMPMVVTLSTGYPGYDRKAVTLEVPSTGESILLPFSKFDPTTRLFKVTPTPAASTAVVVEYSDDNFATTTQVYPAVNQAPSISLIGNPAPSFFTGNPYVEEGATASDAEDGDLTANIVIDSSTVNTAEPGTYLVTYNVSDSDGLAAPQVVRTVTVLNQAPSISLIGESNVNVPFGGTYVEQGATASDFEDGDLTANIVISVNDEVNGSVNTMVSGTYVIKYNVVDSHGTNAPEIARVVQVLANNAPSIVLNGLANVYLTQNDTYTELGATATDPEQGDLSASVTISGAVDTSTVGSYVLTYEIVDEGGANATVTRTVEVAPPAMEVSYDSTGTLPMVNTTRIGTDGVAQSWTYHLGGIAGDQIDFNENAVTTSRPATNIEFGLWRPYFATQGYGTSGFTTSNGEYSADFVALPSTWTIPAWDNTLDYHNENGRQYGRAGVATLYVRITDEYGLVTEHVLYDTSLNNGNYKFEFIEYEDELAWRLGQTRVEAERWFFQAGGGAISWALPSTITGTNVAGPETLSPGTFSGQYNDTSMGNPAGQNHVAFALVAGETYTFNGFDDTAWELQDASSNTLDMTPYNFVQAATYYSHYPDYATSGLTDLLPVASGGTFSIPTFDTNVFGDYRDVAFNLGLTSNNGTGAGSGQYVFAVLRVYKDLTAFNARDLDQDGSDVTTDADDGDPNVQ